MGRPMASEQNKKLGLAFAEAVTVSTEDSSDVIARTGAQRVIAALVECCPSCIRHIGSSLGRKGLTGIELNKTLVSNGFQKVRNRRAHRENACFGSARGGRRMRSCPSGSSTRAGSALSRPFPSLRRNVTGISFTASVETITQCGSSIWSLRVSSPGSTGLILSRMQGSAPALSAPAGFLAERRNYPYRI